MTDPARESDFRSSAQDELDAILRDARVHRHVDEEENTVDIAPEPRPRLSPAPGKGSAPVRTTPGRAEVRFDTFDIKLSDPGEMKFKSFRPSARAIVVVMLGIAAGVLWAVSPNGVGFLHPTPLPDSYTEASARWAMVVTADRIDRYRSDHQRLPETLEEMGPAPSDLITYERLADGQYRLQAPGTNSPLSLSPTSSRQIFASNSLDILRLGPDKAP